MNECLQFRRQYLADPYSQDPETLRHKRECRACAGLVAEQAQLESSLIEAINVEIPERLPARIILAQTTHQSRKYRFLAVAATVMLAVSAIMAFLVKPHTSSLDKTVIAHIENEIDHLGDTGRVPQTRVVRLLGNVGVEVRRSFGVVRFASLCPIRKHRGGHLIIAGEKGPVTILLMPGEAIAERRTVESGGFRGIIVPMGHGSMAIVGEAGEPLEQIEQRLRAGLVVQF